MTNQQLLQFGAEEAAKAIRAFLMNAPDASARQVVYRIRERVHGELYRREREHYPEWIHHGGQG